MGRLVGIDLGTTNSVVAVMEKGRPQVLESRENRPQTRSVVGLKRRRDPGAGSGEILVGDAAVDNWPLAPRDTIFSIKRLMGRGVGDDEVQRIRQWATYDIVEPPDGTKDSIRVPVGGELYSPIDVSAMILRKLKEDAEFRLGEEVTHAVITVPAYFSHIQKDATLKAGWKAGLKVIQILDEPTAAAVAYGLDAGDSATTKTVLVFDLGGGTFDISVLVMAGGAYAPLNLEGDMWLGGDNLDEVLMAAAVAQVQREYGITAALSDRSLAELRKAVQRTKEMLSSAQSADLVVPALLQHEGQLVDLVMEVTRNEFESGIEHLVDRMMALARKALDNANLTVDEIDAVLMAGNATSVPLVQHAVEEMFGASKVLRSIHPKHCVAQGAAIVAAMIGPKTRCVAPSVDDPGAECGHVNPPDVETCERCGAPLSGDPGLFGKIAPFSYGAQTAGDVFTVFVTKGESYPTESPRSHVFHTRVPNARMISIPIYGGDDTGRASANVRQGEAFAILPPDLPSGTPVRVRLWLDHDGTFQLSAHLEDGTDLNPWIVEKGEAQERALSALDDAQRDLGESDRAAQAEALREIEALRERVFDHMQAGRFAEAVEDAEELRRKAREAGGSMSEEQLRTKATNLFGFASFVLHTYGWMLSDGKRQRLESLLSDLRAAMDRDDDAQLTAVVDQLDRETDDLPDDMKMLLAVRGAIASRVRPFEPRTAEEFAERLEEVEAALQRGEMTAATTALEALLEDIMRTVDELPVPPSAQVCPNGHPNPSGERFCPVCGDDTLVLKA
jgi:molecular chaperone DnaK (HSP70)